MIEVQMESPAEWGLCSNGWMAGNPAVPVGVANHVGFCSDARGNAAQPAQTKDEPNGSKQEIDGTEGTAVVRRRQGDTSSGSCLAGLGTRRCRLDPTAAGDDRSQGSPEEGGRPQEPAYRTGVRERQARSRPPRLETLTPAAIRSATAGPHGGGAKGNTMHIQVNTDRNIPGDQRLELYVRSTVEAALGRFGEQITRVEVHLSDENGERSRGDDKRCLVEARPAGRQPVVVTHVAGTVAAAIDGAVGKLERHLDSTFGRLHDSKGRPSLRNLDPG
jgi:ribosome-associated translation inhibitor RaiA